ncbi:MAG: hemolysin III family protein [Treponema sp.]|jgi:hemolysin III|nr:hemolysin III family protein [Treponema sp.]
MGMRLQKKIISQTTGEEIANSILHGFGVLLGILGLIFLVQRANGLFGGSGLSGGGLTTYVIFAAAMILMFLASALYHGLQSPGVKKLFRVFDHQAIYIFIAGTYTPFCLLGLKGAWGWSLLGFEWALALAGIILYGVNCRFIKKVELVIYMLMGWAIFASFVPLIKSLSPRSLFLLFTGGAAYTAGTFWYRSGKTIRGNHVVWHVFVLAGAVCHFWAVWFLS